MIKPEWLEGAFVVRNEGLEYEAADADFTSRRTLVTLQHYRDFAAHHPNQVTYFQPILDVLDYTPSKLENVPSVAMVEGKGDYYVIRLMQRTLSGAGPSFVMPGGGAGGLDPVIQLYLGWARDFVILLDSDKEGHRQRDRYIEKFGELLRPRILLLEDIETSWKGKSIEGLFEPAELIAIQQSGYPATNDYKKTHFHRSVQELLVTRASVSVGEASLGAFRRLLDALQERLSSIAQS